ncbi:hypothetical protein TcWFU_008074 [Taenia crassiceps]|uniref:Uncharacterized protein n=1 Tax=Taenia crassiceps TaxID=6207 RepID=A0ABR4QSU9_9CEST
MTGGVRAFNMMQGVTLLGQNLGHFEMKNDGRGESNKFGALYCEDDRRLRVVIASALRFQGGLYGQRTGRARSSKAVVLIMSSLHQKIAFYHASVTHADVFLETYAFYGSMKYLLRPFTWQSACRGAVQLPLPPFFGEQFTWKILHLSVEEVSRAWGMKRHSAARVNEEGQTNNL